MLPLASFRDTTFVALHESSRLNILDIVKRNPEPQPWVEVAKIPWDNPDFSRRMLAEHLSQEHDAASRRASIIDRQVEWIHRRVLNEQPSDVLDLGCGPGFYCDRLARLGHRCTGIDFGPASIEYARSMDEGGTLNCEYVLGDLRETGFGTGRDLIMLLFGEFNVFSRADALGFLCRARQALAPSAKILLEAHTLESIRTRGETAPSWTAMECGLFSDRPYIRLDDACWRTADKATIERHYCDRRRHRRRIALRHNDTGVYTARVR